MRIPIFDDKYTLCISSQAGCPLDCVFCATGRLGFTRNLATWEIVEQLRIIRDEADRPVRGVVFMGMGEPFLNYDNVIRAARIFADPSGGAISGRAITISTAGVVPAIRRFTAERHPYRLAISLTGATRAQRRSLMPAAEKTWPIDELIDAVREHAEVDARPGHARVRRHRRRQLRRRRRRGAVRAACAASRCASTSSTSTTPPAASRRRRTPSGKAFVDALQPLGAPIVRRYSGGKDVDAACGMLAATT